MEEILPLTAKSGNMAHKWHVSSRAALPVALMGLRMYLGGVFLWSSVAKLASLWEFEQTVSVYGILPPALVGAFATVVAHAELALALCLILGLGLKTAARGSQLLLSVFIVAVVVNLARGRSIPCGCFGSAESISWRTVARDTGWLFLLQALIEGLRHVARRTVWESRKPFALVGWALVACLTASSPSWAGVMLPTTVHADQGEAIERGGPFPGDILSLRDLVPDQLNGKAFLLALTADDVDSQLLDAWLEEESGALGCPVVRFSDDAEDDPIPQQLEGTPFPSLVLVDSQGRVLLRWVSFELCSWSMLSEGVQSQVEHLGPPTGQFRLQPGTPVEPLELFDQSGGSVRVDLQSTRRCVLYFADPRCSICPEVTRWLKLNRRLFPPGTRVIPIVLGASSERCQRVALEVLGSDRAGVARQLNAMGVGVEAFGGYSFSEAVTEARRLGWGEPVFFDLDSQIQRKFGVWRVPSLVLFEDGAFKSDYSLSLVHERDGNALGTVLSALGVLLQEETLQPAPLQIERRCES